MPKLVHPDRSPLFETLTTLHLDHWGKPSPSGNLWELSITISPWEETDGKLLTLEQYPTVQTLVNELRNPASHRRYRHKGVLVTSSPGIGKTSCLWYLLVTALCAAEPVILLYDSSLFIITKSGVYKLSSANDAQVVEHGAFTGVLCLVDLDDDTSPIHKAVLSRNSQCFTVAASSPQCKRYQDWVTRLRITTS
ncbi:hypothetical protein BDP27DRAFT_1439877 [Rhodocollybia butyracea]|uniref:Uncharacterized protein n=1 Tax=Rhodocollybia butyracea TaxID=206335 RepID=A0A9P5P5T7_9AGAR|nr:hypothetical protein BDP27DRAFT_1439877 [Rhodocollybia butyracea]